MYIYTKERTASTRVHWNRKSPTEHTEFAEAAAIKSPRDSIFRPPFFSYPFIFVTFCRFTVHLLGTCLWVGCHSWESKKTSEPPPLDELYHFSDEIAGHEDCNSTTQRTKLTRTVLAWHLDGYRVQLFCGCESRLGWPELTHYYYTSI